MTEGVVLHDLRVHDVVSQDGDLRGDAADLAKSLLQVLDGDGLFSLSGVLVLQGPVQLLQWFPRTY